MDRRGARPDGNGAGALPYVGVEHVESMSGTILPLDQGSRVGDGKSNTFLFDTRHVLYGKLRPYLNKVALPDFEGRCSTELVPLLPQASVDRSYLAYLLRRPETVSYVMASVTGARMPRTDMKVLMSMPVPLPPIEEQRRIVDILNRAASIERLRATASAHLRDFVPALFIKMFGDPIENPMGWETVPLGDTLQMAQYGSSKKADAPSDAIPVLRMGNVGYDGYLDCSDLKHVDLSDDEFEKYLLAKGDLLFNRTNSKELVGKTGIWDGRFTAIAASYFIRLRVDPVTIDPTYLWAFMNTASMKARIFGMARGAIGQSNINAKELQAITVPLPPLDRQKKFAELVDAAKDRMTNAAEASELAGGLSQSLLNKLLGTEAASALCA